MKRWWLGVLMVAVSAAAYIPDDAYAKRLGGGRPAGMQRQMPAPNKPMQADPSRPMNGAQQPAPAPSPMAGAAAAAGKRSWMGPLAGLAAGIGLAALFSHFGMGEGLANFMMLALLAVAAVFVIRFLISRFAGQRGTPMATMNPAPGGMSFQNAGFGGANGNTPSANVPARIEPVMTKGADFASAPAFGGSAAAAAPAATTHSFAVPSGFDVPAFERIAKMIFIRMQAANDVGDLNDLRQFTTPELFASVRLELQERGGRPQQTDVVKLDTEVLDIARENASQVVSVRFHGLIREETGGVAAPFDEVWHLIKPEDGSREWAIAGIAQYA